MLANEERKRRLIKKRLEEENMANMSSVVTSEGVEEGKADQGEKGDEAGSDQVNIWAQLFKASLA